MSPMSASTGEAWILLGAIVLFVGTVLHMIRALKLSNAPKASHAKAADLSDDVDAKATVSVAAAAAVSVTTAAAAAAAVTVTVTATNVKVKVKVKGADSLGTAEVKWADALDAWGWGFLCAGALTVAVGTWATFYG